MKGEEDQFRRYNAAAAPKKQRLTRHMSVTKEDESDNTVDQRGCQYPAGSSAQYVMNRDEGSSCSPYGYLRLSAVITATPGDSDSWHRVISSKKPTVVAETSLILRKYYGCL